jgi:hypothetical protein
MRRNPIQNQEDNYRLLLYRNQNLQQRRGFRFQEFLQKPLLGLCLMSSPKEQQKP